MTSRQFMFIKRSCFLILVCLLASLLVLFVATSRHGGLPRVFPGHEIDRFYQQAQPLSDLSDAIRDLSSRTDVARQERALIGVLMSTHKLTSANYDQIASAVVDGSLCDPRLWPLVRRLLTDLWPEMEPRIREAISEAGQLSADCRARLVEVLDRNP